MMVDQVLERFAAVGGAAGLVPVLLQEAGNKLCAVGLVIYDENICHTTLTP